MEKKTHEELLAETPSAWREPSVTRGGRPPADDGRDPRSGLRDLIARRAYELYEERGRVGGDEVNDWLRAEAEVFSSLSLNDQRVIDTVKRRRQSAAIGARGE